jgi:hypothetical protein
MPLHAQNGPAASRNAVGFQHLRRERCALRNLSGWLVAGSDCGVTGNLMVEFRTALRSIMATFSESSGTTVQDMEAHLEKLLNDAEECALISKLATDVAKRELFARLSEHLKMLAAEVERAIKERKEAG